MQSFNDIREDYEFLDERDDRYRLIIDLGRELEPMEEALKTERTQVKGCLSQVWAYPTVNSDGTLHFKADSNSAITKGIIALILKLVQDQPPCDVLAIDIKAQLSPFEIERHLTSNRTQGIPNMIALIRETAARYA
ncbi:SufE family protein [Sphingomonas sp. KR1UV-12]|uniref:SufE family protein n=1 Tax=Sphingomonas aurea TaxID=3063994 RepID=A0ABT9EGR2_9SPHN|nr:SufE family protein [Sphingomonas sp. KR1UV-12]MDP1026030.1 SufE family protein [Sphingomonas sp. KR1UV-12]